jgi:hypothetical protein
MSKNKTQSKPLRVPRWRPKQWEVGDMAIKYITLRPDDDPEPPCILMLVTDVVGEKCECAHLDMNYTEMIEARYLLSVEDAVAHFEHLANDGTMTFRYHRIAPNGSSSSSGGTKTRTITRTGSQ